MERGSSGTYVRWTVLLVQIKSQKPLDITDRPRHNEAMNNNDGTNHPGDLLGALIFGALGLAFFLALSWALDNSPTMQDEPTEDSAGWECEQDGNGVCGPLIATAEDYGIVVEDATGTLGVVRWEMTDALAPEKAWDACITAADVVAEGDVPAGTSEVLTDLCSTMVGYID